MSKQITLKPRQSEKSYALSEAVSTYVFDVPAELNKLTIAEAITSQFGVKVIKVRVAGVPGKQKRAYRKHGRNVKTRRSDLRKAYVTLAKGDKLPIFQAVEEEVKAEKKADK